jgi:large subunit ribosomal protein L4
MKTSLFNIQGEIIGQITLPSKTFDVKVSPTIIAQSIRVYLANQRKSHAKAKDRGDVSGTTKKMWSQKGTGRARHGSAKAGIFVGGGSAHGPQGNQNYKLKLSKKMKTAALKAVFTQFATNKCIIVVDKLSTLEPKTKIAQSFIDKIEKQSELLAKSKKIGIISSKSLVNVNRAFGNIPGFSLMSLSSLNTYNLSNQNILIFTKKAIESLK